MEKENQRGQNMIVYMVISLVILAVGIYLAREKRNDFKMLSLIMTLAIGLAVGVLVIPFFQLSNPNFFFHTSCQLPLRQPDHRNECQQFDRRHPGSQ